LTGGSQRLFPATMSFLVAMPEKLAASAFLPMANGPGRDP
jgi:hypothetical protein